jgi:predicted RNA methylase
LFKFIQYRADSCNPNELLPIFLEALPVSGDVIEAKIVHENLIKLVTQNNPIILGQGSKNIPRLLQIFADIIDTKLVNDETNKNIREILKQVSSQPQLLQQAAALLTQEQQQKLQQAMRGGQ